MSSVTVRPQKRPWQAKNAFIWLGPVNFPVSREFGLETIEWLGVVSTPAAADRDASFTMERVDFLDNIAKAFLRKCEFDKMREVPFGPKADGLPLVTATHLVQSSSASRFTAGAARFFILSQSGERPERYIESLRFDTMPSRSILQAWAKTVGPSPSKCSLNRMPGRALATIDASVALRTSSGSRRRSSPFSSMRSKAYRNMLSLARW